MNASHVATCLIPKEAAKLIEEAATSCYYGQSVSLLRFVDRRSPPIQFK